MRDSLVRHFSFKVKGSMKTDGGTKLFQKSNKALCLKTKLRQHYIVQARNLRFLGIQKKWGRLLFISNISVGNCLLGLHITFKEKNLILAA